MKPIVKVPLKFGAFGAAMLSAVFFVSFFLGKNPFGTAVYLDIVLLTIFIFFCIKEYKDYNNDGLLEFSEGMTLGFICYGTIALATALIIGLGAVINEEILLLNIQNALEHVENDATDFKEQFGDDVTQQTIKDLKENTTPAKLIFDVLIKKAAIGLMLTIMMSVIMRRKPKDPEKN